MAHVIESIIDGSIAQELGILPGDELCSISGEAIVDFVDYRALECRERMTLSIRRGAEIVDYDFEKDVYEPIGLVFADDLFGETRRCANKCTFCFVDQLPRGMRDALYVKDDDWRLSFTMGNFVTLTNVSDVELNRIIARRAGPLYISLHTANPELRVSMMRNPQAGKIMDRLERLKRGGIGFHLQIVLCPGYNDGDELSKTIEAAVKLSPAARSLAVVPVGLTAHREGLPALMPVDKTVALDTIRRIHAYQNAFIKTMDTRFVYAADELYQTANLPIPKDAAYEDYPQMGNGVGLLRSFAEEYTAIWEKTPIRGEAIIATGASAAEFIRQLLTKYPPGMHVRVIEIENTLFGNSVTVAGLLSGKDVLAAMKNAVADLLLISESMLNDGVFLDDITLEDVRAATNIPIIPVSNGEDLFIRLKGGQG